MATNPYFPKGVSSEQAILQSLVTESVKVQGMDVYYIPRKNRRLDLVFGEDILSKFDEAITIEMYMENPQWTGEQDLIAKFGMQVKETLFFVISKPRWQEAIQSAVQGKVYNSLRPAEGDLIYEPVSRNLYEITYVDLESPFYQLNKQYQYRLSCQLFIYSNEVLDTGVPEIDKIEEEFGNDSLNYQIDGEDGIALQLENGQFLTHDDESERSPFQFNKNEPIKTEAVTDNFKVNNPFGEL